MNNTEKEDYEIGYCDKCIQSTNHLSGVCQKCLSHTIRQEALTEQKMKFKEMVENKRRMESDYDDEDKRNRRDVRPYNEALDETLSELTNL